MYIKNISKNKVLGATNDCKVILQDFAEDNPKQLWKGLPHTEGYFVLENFQLPMVLTAVSLNSLEIKGLIAMQESNWNLDSYTRNTLEISINPILNLQLFHDTELLTLKLAFW